MSRNEADISGVILAGGENKRFKGKNKARIEIDGKPIISSSLSILNKVFNDIIIVTNSPEELAEYSNFRMIPDIFIRIGPLGGIHAALKDTKLDAVFVVGCDMPWLSKEIIDLMINRFKKSDCEVLIPRMGGLDEPLHAVYKRDIMGRLEDFLSTTDSYSIREFLKLVRVEYIIIDDLKKGRKAFTNLNTPEDMKRVIGESGF